MDRIIVSGITGFVGRNLREYIKEKFEIIGVSRVENINSNITSYHKLTSKSMDNTKAFVHLAGKAHDLKNVSDPKEYYEINTDLTKKLFDLFLNSSCKTFIFISTIKAVVDKSEGVLDENYESSPQTHYGISKQLAEQYILSKQLPDNKHIYILRPCMIHGPNNKGNLNLLYKAIVKNIPYPLGSFDNKRSFLSIQNLIYIIEQLIKKQPNSGVFNVADDQPVSTKKLVKLIAEITNKRGTIYNVPKPVITLIGKIGDVFKLPINSHRIEKLTESFQVSNLKIKKTLEIDLPISADEGLKKTILSFNNQKK